MRDGHLLGRHAVRPRSAAARRRRALPIRTEDAAALFGGQLDKNAVQDIHLFGILALDHGGAAIIGVGGEPPRAVSLGADVTSGAKLAEVRPRSIIVERNGARTEVQLPANTPSPAIYVR